MIRLGKRAAALISTAIAVSTALPAYPMAVPACDRPAQAVRADQHAARHYIENPGPIGRPDTSFFSYSLLDPPTANTHRIRNSVCNTHQQIALSFKWEPVGLSHQNLPKGECFCSQSPLELKHEDVEVLEPAAAHIQFTNTSTRNALSAIAFMRKDTLHSEDASPLQNFIDVIIQRAEKVFRQRISFSSSWTDKTASLQVSGDTDEKFLIAISLPQGLLERAKADLAGRNSLDDTILIKSSVADLDIKDRSWIPDRMQTGGIVALSPKSPKFANRVYSLAAPNVETIEAQVAVFSNDAARAFIAAAPIAIYAPSSK
jgi:hypothetical protein